MAKYIHFINDKCWEALTPLLPKPKRSYIGVRLAADNRQMLEKAPVDLTYRGALTGSS